MPHFLTHKSPRQLMLEPGKIEHCVDSCGTNSLYLLLENCNFLSGCSCSQYISSSFFLMASMPVWCSARLVSSKMQHHVFNSVFTGRFDQTLRETPCLSSWVHAMWNACICSCIVLTHFSCMALVCFREKTVDGVFDYMVRHNSLVQYVVIRTTQKSNLVLILSN